MKNKTMLLALLVASCLLAQSAFAQYPWGVVWDPDALAQFLFPGMNREWLRLPDVLYYVILPFIAAFTVVYGLLRELRIFRHAPNKINIVLAFCMAFLLLPSGILTLLVTFLYAGSALVGIVAFGIVFLIGILLWAYGTTTRLWSEYTPEALESALRDYNKRYADLQKELIRIDEDIARDPKNQRLIAKRLNIEGERDQILKRRADMIQSLKAQGR